MDPNDVVGAPSAQPQPAPTAAATISAELAATPEPAKLENPMAAVEPEKKSSKGGIIAAILFAIIAAGGVGFGVWAMMDGNTQKNALNDQIATLKKQNSELMEQIAEGGEGSGGEGSSTGTTVDTEDYIYVGEWGIKIKKPDDLKRVSYSVRQTDIVSGGSFLWVWGNIDERLPGFADPFVNSNPLGVIGRLPITSLDGVDCHSGTFEFVFSDNEYNYCYSHPQSTYSSGDEEIGSEKLAIELIQQMLKNKEDYSAI